MPSPHLHPSSRERTSRLSWSQEGEIWGWIYSMLVSQSRCPASSSSFVQPEAPKPRLLPPSHTEHFVDIVAARPHTPQHSSAACPSRYCCIHQSWRELRPLQKLVPCQQQPPMASSRETPSALIFPLYRTLAILFSNLHSGLLISSSRRMAFFLATAV
jgi:hypothetical protein